jgi:uncharacterized protein (TIGR00266 family)
MSFKPPKTPSFVPDEAQKQQPPKYSYSSPDQGKPAPLPYGDAQSTTEPEAQQTTSPQPSTQSPPATQTPAENDTEEKLTTAVKPRHSHEIEYSIHGGDVQYVEVTLDPGETVVGEAGAMMYMDEGIQMDTKLSDGSQRGSGMLGSLVGAAKRKLAGEGAFITHFTNQLDGKRHVAFSAPSPGQIIALDLSQVGGRVLCQKDAFLCAAKGISVGIGFTKRLGAGWMGGEGFILQKVEGDGLAFIHAGGTMTEKLLKPGQIIYVDTGSLVAFQNGVDFDIQMISGMKNMMFGGEDMFITSLTGPGRIWIQSMPYPRLVGNILNVMESNMERKK